MKNDLPRFDHDNDARNHPKMKALLTAYGFEGYGRFWALNEVVAAAEDVKLDLSRRINRLALASDLGLSEKALDDFIRFLADPEIDLINFQDGIITTDRTQEAFERVYKKRYEDQDRYKNRASKNSGVENANSTAENANSGVENQIPVPENIQSRVEKSRVDQSREEKSSGGRSDYSDPAPEKNSGPGNPALPPPPEIIKKIQTESLRIGFAIEENLASKISGLLPSWFDGPYSFLAFTAERVRKKYPGKPEEQLRDLYRKALWAWDNLREEYPPWREARLKAAEAKTTQKARDSPPDTCPECGEKTGAAGKCSKCGGFFEWDSVLKIHLFKSGGGDFAKDFRDFKRDKIRPQEVPKPPEEIDF